MFNYFALSTLSKHGLAAFLPHRTVKALLIFFFNVELAPHILLDQVCVNYNKPEFPMWQIMVFPLLAADDLWSRPIQQQMYSSCYPGAMAV